MIVDFENPELNGNNSSYLKAVYDDMTDTTLDFYQLALQDFLASRPLSYDATFGEAASKQKTVTTCKPLGSR